MRLPLHLNSRVPIEPETYRRKTWEVAVDLGSTYSAASFCLTSESTDLLQAGFVEQVNGYQQTRGNESGKTTRSEVPTHIRYEQNGKFIRWGYEAAVMAERGTDRTIPGVDIQLWKPDLNDINTEGVPVRHINEEKDQFSLEKSVDEVTIDFLSRLFQHVQTRMAAKGYNDPDIVHMACTVPAMWSRRAKRRTLNALLEAGKRSNFPFGEDVSIWSEPEAATAYVMASIENIKWVEGDTFVLCDAGGVTVDVVTYKVSSIKPLRLKEVVRGDGAFSGSSELNKGFQQQVDGRLSDQKEHLAKVPNGISYDKMMRKIVSVFENNIKPAYTGPHDMEWPIQVPGLPRDEVRSFEASEMVVTPEHLELVFRPILNSAWGLVESQLERAYKKRRQPTRILGVGGLSCSERFQRHFREKANEFSNRANWKEITVDFPKSPECAVAAGAIYTSLENCLVEDHISRSNIAISRHEIYQPRQKAHKNSRPQFDILEGRDYVHNCVELLLKIDDMIPSTGLKKTRHLHCTIPYTDEKLTLPVHILVSEDETVEDHYPIDHPVNQDKFEKLEKVSFELDVAKLREKLPRLNTRDHHQLSAPLRAQRRSTRSQKGHPTSKIAGNQALTNSSPISEIGERRHEQSPGTYTPTTEGASSDHESGGIDYLWVDYRLDVEFKEMFMYYEVCCPDADNYSVKGKVNLTPDLERWNVDG